MLDMVKVVSERRFKKALFEGISNEYEGFKTKYPQTIFPKIGEVNDTLESCKMNNVLDKASEDVIKKYYYYY